MKLRKIILSLVRFYLPICFILPWGLQLNAQNIPYTTGNWNSDTLGNHRVVVKVNAAAEAVVVQVDWRRRDHHPENINVIVTDANLHRINNVHIAVINRETCNLVFEPTSGKGVYYLFYMPYISKGSANYPTVFYQKPLLQADKNWLTKVASQPVNSLSKAVVIEIQSINALNSFYPMEVIAKKTEVTTLLAQHKDKAFLLFPELRRYSIRMTEDLPLRWIQHGTNGVISDSASRNEYFTFQVGVVSYQQSFNNCKVTYSDLKSSNYIIKSKEFTCFNTEGFDSEGKPFLKSCKLEKGKVQPLWMGIQIPKAAKTGWYTATVTITPEGAKAQSFVLKLFVNNAILADKGDSNPYALTRLRWLNSRLAFDDELVPPYTALTRKGNVLSCLGREVCLNQMGFPEQIKSFYSVEMTHFNQTPFNLLAAPVGFVVEDEMGAPLKFDVKNSTYTKEKPGTIAWKNVLTNPAVKMGINAQLEFDGCMEYQVTLTALKDGSFNDVRLQIPYSATAAHFLMGMGQKGGVRPDSFSWKWNQQKNQDAIWIGNVNGGIQTSFKDTNYVRPLNTNFYLQKPLNMPPSWYNNGKGGCTTRVDGDTYLLTSYSGKRMVRKGEVLHFYFRLLITPFHLLNTDSQWSTRYYHKFNDLDTIQKEGANTVNVHHATEINPFINYPFLRPAAMKKYIDEAHSRNMKVKIYYTVRELTNSAPEVHMLRSLGDEVLSHGKGNGFSWLQEHLDSNYIAAWFVPELKDAAIVNSGVSRWHNYYVEGLNWLTENVGIDGLYIDDVAFDRTTMKRVRKILDRNRTGAMIDLHSANQYNRNDGFASSTNLYLEHFPYLNRLWFGEYFDYNSQPDYWMTEISGIPYGLMGEMLQDNGNLWRGMIYGMTNRRPWSGDPRPIWNVWDKFGMQGSEMIGYWVPNSPVKTNNAEVLATVYRKEHKTLVAIASWAKNAEKVKLIIDWKKLGIDSLKAKLTAWEVKDFQPAAMFNPDDEILIQPGKGWLLIVE
ncbi:MAG: hypothetical protein HXX14_12170 [Bacteroidetes bacterium]|nr:hypothetical protein [Bacteroidota bacterium]